MGKAMLRVALVFAQLEREQTSERITDVMSYRASLGYFNGGPSPYGYHVLNKELLPNKKEQSVVELIFSKFLETRSLSSVARFLNDTRIRSRKDGAWQDTYIQKILQNPVYIGQVRWNDQLYPGLHLPLIAKTTFEEVQAIFATTRLTKRRSQSNALLQQLLHCGHCQCPMTTSFAYNRSKTRYQYYRCTSTMKAEFHTSTCTLKYIPQAELETQFFSSLLQLCRPSQMNPIHNRITAYNQELEARISPIHHQIEVCERQLFEIKAQRSNYLDALITKDFLSEERQLIRSQIQTLETEERQLQSQLSHFRLERNQFEESRIHFDHFKSRFIQLLDLHRFIQLLDLHQQQNTAQLQRQLPNILRTATLNETQWALQFIDLPWPIDLPILDTAGKSQ
jgi:site-specific DNA recombinase